MIATPREGIRFSQAQEWLIENYGKHFNVEYVGSQLVFVFYDDVISSKSESENFLILHPNVVYMDVKIRKPLKRTG